MNAVASGFGADIYYRRANTCGGGIENFVRAGEANTHGINENITVITTVKIDLTANCRDADAVAVTANTVNNASDQMSGLGMTWVAKAQGIHISDWTCAHSENIAHNAANTRCRTLIGFDE